MKSIYILYKTVRTETGEYYIGVHGINTDKFPQFDDPYLGSGDRILASKKKHGAKAFKRSILSISEDRDVVLALEASMVTVEMIADPLCLNIAPGGRGGGSRKGVPSPNKGSKLSAEHRQAISDALKGVPSPKKGIPTGPFSVEHRQALSDARKGVPSPKKGSKLSAEHRQAISDALKGVPTGPRSPEHCQAISDALKGVPRSAETRQAISDGQRGKIQSLETRQAISDAKKEWWRQRKLAKRQ